MLVTILVSRINSRRLSLIFHLLNPSATFFMFCDLRFLLAHVSYARSPPVTMKTLLCAATCFVLPSWASAQSMAGSTTSPQTPVVFLSTNELAQSSNYTVQPVFVNDASASVGGGDLASPVYTSIQASDSSQTTDLSDPNFAPMPANANVVGPGSVQTAQSASDDGSLDPNHGLVTVQMVPVGEVVSTTISRTTEIAANPVGSTQADGFGWRLNALSKNGFNAPCWTGG